VFLRQHAADGFPALDEVTGTNWALTSRPAHESGSYICWHGPAEVDICCATTVIVTFTVTVTVTSTIAMSTAVWPPIDAAQLVKEQAQSQVPSRTIAQWLHAGPARRMLTRRRLGPRA
jgi:hypothetical protein